MDPPARWSALTGERRRSCSASLESFVAQIIPIGYVTIREAAEVIAQSRFAGVADRPEVTKLRRLGVDAADGAAIDDAVAALWKAADAGKLRVVAIGGKPRKIVRLDPEDLKEVPFLRSPRGRDFNLLRPSHRLYKSITQWFGLDLTVITIAFREKEVAKLARSVVRARRKDVKSDGVKKKVGRPERQAEVGKLANKVRNMELQAGHPQKKGMHYAAKGAQTGMSMTSPRRLAAPSSGMAFSGSRSNPCRARYLSEDDDHGRHRSIGRKDR
jgi:hypothetical protein